MRVAGDGLSGYQVNCQPIIIIIISQSRHLAAKLTSGCLLDAVRGGAVASGRLILTNFQQSGARPVCGGMVRW